MKVHEIPDKLYFKIGEVSQIMGLPAYVLRYWQTEFPEITPSKSRTQQRLYKKKDLEVILKIKELLYDRRFTIEGARKKLKDELKLERHKVDQLDLALPVKENNVEKISPEIPDALTKVIGAMQKWLEG